MEIALLLEQRRKDDSIIESDVSIPEEIRKTWIISALRGQMPNVDPHQSKLMMKLTEYDKYFLVAAINISKNNEELSNDSIIAWLKNKGILSVLVDGHIVCIVSGSSRNMVHELMNDKIREFTEYMVNISSSLCARVGVSSIGTVEDISALYKQALKANVDAFYEYTNIAIKHYYKETKESRSIMYEQLDKIHLGELTQRISNAVTEKDETGVGRALNELFERISQARPQKLDAVIITCMEIFMAAERSCLDHVKELEPISKAELYTYLRDASNISQLHDYFHDKLIKLMRIYKSKRDEMSNDIVWRACSFIKDNIEQSISLSDVAEHVHVNASYLSRVFTKTMGMSMMQFINEQRISLAKKLLADGAMSVQEIAYKLGYSEYRYFSTLFKKHTGMTPLHFRKSVLKGKES